MGFAEIVQPVFILIVGLARGKGKNIPKIACLKHAAIGERHEYATYLRGEDVMHDRFGREINYLRMSITERCNLHCIYCRDETNCFTGGNELTDKEISRIVKQMVSLGTKKVRITGGEPLARQDLECIIADIACHEQVIDLCMTTNGHGLAQRIKELQRAGLQRLNISLDSLREERYSQITCGGHLSEVLKGIEAAVGSGIELIKINTVLIRGQNDNEIDDFIRFAKEHPIDVRFIELMPIGRLGQDSTKRITSDEILAQHLELRRIPPRNKSQPSEDYAGEGFKGRVGFISPVSHKFCMDCNRIRLTSDGFLRMCLGNNTEVDLRPALQMSDSALLEVIQQAIWNKPLKHQFETMFHSQRAMNRIGG